MFWRCYVNYDSDNLKEGFLVILNNILKIIINFFKINKKKKSKLKNFLDILMKKKIFKKLIRSLLMINDEINFIFIFNYIFFILNKV